MSKTCKHTVTKTCMHSSWYNECSNHEDTKTHPLTHRERERTKKGKKESK